MQCSTKRSCRYCCIAAQHKSHHSGKQCPIPKTSWQWTQWLVWWFQKFLQIEWHQTWPEKREIRPTISPWIWYKCITYFQWTQSFRTWCFIKRILYRLNPIWSILYGSWLMEYKHRWKVKGLSVEHCFHNGKRNGSLTGPLCKQQSCQSAKSLGRLYTILYFILKP